MTDRHARGGRREDGPFFVSPGEIPAQVRPEPLGQAWPGRNATNKPSASAQIVSRSLIRPDRNRLRPDSESNLASMLSLVSIGAMCR